MLRYVWYSNGEKLHVCLELGKDEWEDCSREREDGRDGKGRGDGEPKGEREKGNA